MIRAQKISFSYGAEPIFEEASFTVGRNQKTGLVGINGAGKSTFFKLIMGSEYVSSGTIDVIGSIGYVPQEIREDPLIKGIETILEYVNPGDMLEKYELGRFLSGLELGSIDLSLKPTSLSGGQKTKLALARTLIQEPEILLLDEPTNFMDVSGKRFVMNFLADYKKTVICISHDLDLMDSSIDKIFEINSNTKKIDEYKGNYSMYKRLRKERETHLKRSIRVKEQHIKQMEKSLVKLYANRSAKGVRQRVVHQRRLEKEKATLPSMPKAAKKFKLNLSVPPRVAEIPIRSINVSKSFNERNVLTDLNFVLERGEKMVVIGSNGVGKSTLIKTLLGMIKPDSGYVSRADNIKIGYYSQEFETFDLDEKVLDFVCDVGNVHDQRARSFLGRFMFDDIKVKQKISSLSGGEKTRLSIALLMLGNNNVLILDEPTTYLDPLSQRIILEAIKEYKGTLILVSHVPSFIKEIEPDRAFLMPEGRTVFWDDNLLSKIEEI